MQIVRPESPDQLAALLHNAAASKQTIRLGGSFTKDDMGGPAVSGDVCLSTAALSRVVQYEPKDLTISVEAGMRWAELSALLSRNGQMIPLDPPCFDQATVGGVVAANCSGPRRRLYGTVRDAVIGMTFATLEGKLVQSGGMVVKNVAGLDMAKLMIGSFGTLAAIATVNFKLTPIPADSRTFVFHFENLQDSFAARDRILQSVLQPAALDLLNPAASDRGGLRGYCLLVQAGGDPAVLDRYGRELAGASALNDADSAELWSAVREFVPRYLSDYPQGAVLRYSSTLSGIRNVFQNHSEPCLARAGTGVTYVCVENASEASAAKGSVVEWSPERVKRSLELWPAPGPEFEVMKKIKSMFDPAGLLNPGRLYGRI
jgi:glycolate oxidase FAD binding subunit